MPHIWWKSISLPFTASKLRKSEIYDINQHNFTTPLEYPLQSSSSHHTLKINQIELSWGSQGFYLKIVEFQEYQNLFWNPSLHICHQYLFPKIKEKGKSLCKIEKEKRTCLSIQGLLLSVSNLSYVTWNKETTINLSWITKHCFTSLLGKFDDIC